jgi:hypothetical protein
MHALGSRVHEPGLNLHDVADQQRAVEADAAGEHGHRVHSAVAGGADVGGFVDPLHHDAAVHLSAPVHVRGSGHEPEGHPLGRASIGIFLPVHGFHDLLADLDAGQRMVPLLDLFKG